MRITVWLRNGLVRSPRSMRQYTPSSAVSTHGLSRSSYSVIELIASMSALVVLSSERASKLVSMILESILAHV